MQRVAAVDIYAFGGTENDDLRGQIVLAAAVRLPAGKIDDDVEIIHRIIAQRVDKALKGDVDRLAQHGDVYPFGQILEYEARRRHGERPRGDVEPGNGRGMVYYSGFVGDE